MLDYSDTAHGGTLWKCKDVVDEAKLFQLFLMSGQIKKLCICKLWVMTLIDRFSILNVSGTTVIKNDWQTKLEAVTGAGLPFTVL